jgi:hypothetical protein
VAATDPEAVGAAANMAASAPTISKNPDFMTAQPFGQLKLTAGKSGYRIADHNRPGLNAAHSAIGTGSFTGLTFWDE